MGFYLTDGMQGVSLTNTRTSAEGPEFTIGERHHGNKGTEWMYVRALSTIPVWAAVAINVSSNAVPITTTNVSTAGVALGFAQTAIASTSFGWVAMQGRDLKVLGAASVAVGAALYTTATAGVLDDAIVTAGHCHGVMATISISAASVLAISAQFAHVGRT